MRPRAAWLAEFDVPLLLLALLLTVSVLSYFWTPTDPDLWWHLRNGQVVLSTGTVPHADIYSYTVPGTRWIMQQWLLETGMYAIEHTLGYPALVLLFALVTTTTYAILFGTLRAEGAARPVAVAAVLPVMLLDAPAWGVRPQVWTTLFFTAFLAILLRYRRRGPDRILWLLPVLMLLWANFHAGFTVGLLLLGAFVAGTAGAWLLRWPAAPVRPLLAVAVACAAASLLNPNGLDLWLYPLTYLGGTQGNPSIRFIQEWQPPDIRSIRSWPLFGTLLALLVLNLMRPGRAASTGEESRHRPWGDLALMLALAGFTLMALQAIRFTGLYAVVWGVVAGLRLRDLGFRQGGPMPGRFVRMNVVVYAATALLLAAAILTNVRAQVHAAPLQQDYPAAAVAYMQAQAPTLPAPLHLFHDYYWGGYLVWQGIPVFVDGRADPYNALLDQFVAAQNGQGWQDLFARYGVNAALLHPGAALDPILARTAGWERRYADPGAVLYIKH